MPQNVRICLNVGGTAFQPSLHTLMEGARRGGVVFQRLCVQILGPNTDTAETSDQLREGDRETMLWRGQNINLGGMRLQGQDLSRLAFDNGVLSHVDLSACNLSCCSFRGANMEGANMEGATLQGANLQGADLTLAALPPWDSGLLEGVRLEGARLGGAVGWMGWNKDLHKATLKGADLSGCDLSGCDMREADVSGAILNGANLAGANLEGANLEGVKGAKPGQTRSRPTSSRQTCSICSIRRCFPTKTADSRCAQTPRCPQTHSSSRPTLRAAQSNGSQL